MNLGDLSIGTVVEPPDAQATQKSLDALARRLGFKVKLEVELPSLAAARAELKAAKADLDALGIQGTKANRDQTTSSKALQAQYKATGEAAVQAARVEAAQAAVGAAKLREQAAQVALNTRLANEQRRAEQDRSRQTISGIENEVRAYRNLWQSRVLSNDQVYAQQARLRQQALEMAVTVDKQSDAYRRLTQIAAAAQRTQDAAMGLNTPGGFGAGISQGLTNTLGQFGVTGDLIAGFVQLFSAKRAAAAAEASNLGRDAMAGLVAGMKNNQAQVRDVADLAGDSVAEAIRASLDIHSPSRVTEYLGKMAGLGFVTGMKSYQDEAKAAARALSSAAEGGLRNTATSGGAFGGSGNLDAGNLAASATALAALNQQLAAAQPASEGAAEGAEAAGAAADGLGEAVGGAAEQVKGLRDAHQEQDAASRQAAVNEAQTAIAFTATAAAITAVAAALVVSYNAAADYEAAMNKAKATTDATSQEMAQLNVISKSQNLTDLGINAISAAGGIEELGSQGLNTSQIVGGGLVSSLTLAKAVSSDVAKAASVAAASSKAFGLEADQLGKVADVVTMAVNGTSVKMDNFTEAIAAGGAVAKSQGVNFLEFTAAISLMTDKAIGASDAGTSMKTFLMALTPNSKEATAAMKLLGFSAFDAQGNFKPLGQVVDELRIGFSKLTPEQRAMTAETIFGADGVRAFNILIEAGKQGLLDRVGLLDKNGAATKAASDKMEGARGEQEKFNAELKNFQISMGENFLPAATKMLEWATSFMRAMKDVNTEYGKFVNGQAAFGAQEYNLPTWLKQSGLRERDLTPDQTKEATRLLREMQFQANETAKNAGQWRRLGMEAQAQNVESEGIKVIGRLGALLGKIQAAASSAPRVQGPVQGDGGATPVDYDSAGNLTQYSGDVLRQTAAKTGKQTADMVVDYCAQWTRLTLGNADKRAQAYIDKLFSGDVDKDGQTTAKDYALKAKAAGLLRTYSSPKDLQPGDVVFYTENGQNHSGIYIGGGMLRGNNRVTYAERGGKFDAKGNPISRGIDPVGDVAIDRLGTANSYIRTSDLGRAAGVTERDPRLAGPAGAAPAIPERTFESYRKEAVQILAQIAKFAPGGTAPDGEKWAAATARLKKFGEMSAVAGQAVQYAQLQMGQAGKEVSRYGQTFDRLKGQMDLTDSLDKLGQNVVPQLKAIQLEAQKGAAAEKARWGETEKYRQLLGLAGDAASKLKQITERKPDQTPLQQEQQRRAEQIKQEDMVLKMRGKSAQQLQDIIKGGVIKEGDLDRIVAAQKEVERREELGTKRQKEAKAEAARVNEAIRQNDIAGAQAAFTRLERLRDTGLARVKGDAVAELAIQKQYADLIYNARKAVLDKEKADRDADIKNSTLPQAVKDRQLGTSKQTYDNDLAAAALVRTRALSEATRTVQVETQKQAAAVTDLTQKYAAASALLKTKAQAGTLTAEDMAAYTRQLAGYWDEAGKAGVKSVPALKAAHDAAKAFGLTALDLNGAAVQMAQGAVALDEYPDQAGRFTAAQDRVQASLDDVLGLLPESQEEWAGFIKVMEDLDSKGNLAAGVLDGVRQKMEDLLAAQQAFAGEEAGAQALAEILANPVGEGVSRPDAQGDTQKALYADLLRLFSDLGPEVAKDTTLMALYAEMLDGAGRSGALTAEQLEHLKNVLGEGRASFDALTQGIEASTDALADLAANPVGEGTFRPDGVGAAQQETYDNLRTALEGIDGASLESADSLNLYEQMVENAGEQGAVTAEQLKRLRDILIEIRGAANVEINLADIYNNPDLYGDGGSRPANVPNTFEPAPGFEAPEVTEQDVGYLTQMADVFARFRDGDLANPDQLEAFTSSLRLLKDQGKLTALELQALLGTIDDLTSGDGVGNSKPLSLSEWQEQLQILTDDFDSGVSTADEYAAGLQQLGADLGDMARKADAAGNPKLAQAFRDQAAALRAMNPQIAGALQTLGKVQDYAGYVRDVAGAFGQLADAISEGEQEYDSFTGAKLQTPWKDLAANLEGVQNAAGKVVEIVSDVMRIVANPADIGAWVSLVTKVVSSIADAIAGFQKARAEVSRLKAEFAQDNPFLNADDYQKAFTRSRGFFADVFGGGPEVVNEIDKVGLHFAQTVQEGFANGMRNGLKEGLAKNDLGLFTKSLKEGVGNAILDGIVDSFVQGELLKNIIAPAIKAWSDAMKTTNDPTDDLVARDGLRTAVQQANTLGQAFAQDAMPLLQPLRDDGYFGDSTTSGPGSTFGSGPGASFGGVASVSIPQGVLDSMQQAIAIPAAAFGGHVDRFGGFVARLEALEMQGSGATPGYGIQSAFRRSR